MTGFLPCSVRRVLDTGLVLQSRLLGIAGQAVPELFDPRTYLQVGGRLAWRAADGARAFAAGPGSALASATEVENKSAIFLLVQSVSVVLGVPCTFPLPACELVRRSYDLGAFPALWAIEGTGHDVGASYFEHRTPPREILLTPETRDLPASSLLMMHAGIGLAFAENRLKAVGWRASYPEVRAAVAEVVALCRANARPGCLGAALESLGLVTRLLFPRLLAAVDQALREVASPSTVDYFWHGAGRALYFFPPNFLPFSLGPSYATACREAPDERARRNAVAGLSWAVTLVNQRQPRIMADLMIAPRGEQLRDDPAFTNGVVSSILMRTDTTPGAPFIAEFCDHQPRHPATAALWDQLIRQPCIQGLEVVYPALRRSGRLDEVFRFHDLERLADGDGEASCD